MKTLRLPIALLLLAGPVASAQVPVAPPYAGSDLVSLTPPAGARRSAAELEQLLAPIALYPDALIALILPASTASTDIVLAARQMRDSGIDRSQIEHRAWDESVKSLTYYPDLLKWMDENLPWTKQVGDAFAEQPVDVMQAIQRLRARARAAGTLVDTPQQQVLTDLEVIRIVPAQSSAIYVPYYEPSYVFVDRPVSYIRPFVTFGLGLPVGSWLAFECDWRRHSIWVGNRHRPWNGHDWRRPIVPVPIVAPTYARHPEARQWRPPVHPGRPGFAGAHHTPHPVVRPVPPSFSRPPHVDSRVAGDPARPTPPVRPPNTPGPARRGPPRAVSGEPAAPLPSVAVVPPVASFTPNVATRLPPTTTTAPDNNTGTQRRGRFDRQGPGDSSFQPGTPNSAAPVATTAQPPPPSRPRLERGTTTTSSRGGSPQRDAPPAATSGPAAPNHAQPPPAYRPRQDHSASPSYSRSAQPQTGAPAPAAASARATAAPATAAPATAAPANPPAAAKRDENSTEQTSGRRNSIERLR